MGWVCRAGLDSYFNDYTRVYASLLFGVLGIYNFGCVLVNRTEGYFQVNGYYSFFSLTNCRAGYGCTHIWATTPEHHVSLLFGLLGIYNFGGVLVNPTEGYFQVNGYYSFFSLTNCRAGYGCTHIWATTPEHHVSLLFGLLGIYNFGGVLVNPTEGYFQVNGYSFSSPAKNDVSE